MKPFIWHTLNVAYFTEDVVRVVTGGEEKSNLSGLEQLLASDKNSKLGRCCIYIS
ncbi:hypothetical protein [Paenibacillus sp. FSL R7-0179]|uniref:hypothetical protein n=1 Tax=Paenibacillus sp. FSL R7-0179 TaxID=2921672 RepID=UPI0030F98C24